MQNQFDTLHSHPQRTYPTFRYLHHYIDMQKMIKEIEGTCEKEDLKMTGYVEKVIIVDIIKKYLGDKYAF